jgi:hypothetical protein
MVALAYNMGEGTAKPKGLQFGHKYFLVAEDRRPSYLMADPNTGTIRSYPCGIKAPMTAPWIVASATSATNLTASGYLVVRYCFFSSKRVVRSRLSPPILYQNAATPKQIVIQGFEYPRDDAAMNDIDTIWVGVQMEQLGGFMCLESEMSIDVSDFVFSNKSLTFDLAGDDLALGVNLSEGDALFEIPPAVKDVERYGERIWYGGTRRTVEMDIVGLTVTAGQVFRNNITELLIDTRAKLTLTGDGVWDDSHLHMSLYANGKYIGEIFDVQTNKIAWLDRDVRASIAETTQWMLVGHNDRIWPSGWHNYTVGNIVTSFPECVCLGHQVTFPQALDEGQSFKGMKATRDMMSVVFDDSVVQLTAGKEVNTPLPEIAQDYGRTGATSARSIGRDPSGQVVYVGEEGFTRTNTAGVASIAHELGVNRLFKGGQWIAATDLDDIVMTYSRQYDGYVFGNVTIDGVANWWGLLSLRPQYAVWLFDGQAITSNILEYQDVNGQGVILAGDAYDGRVKRLLDPETLLDVPAASDTAAAYTCEWRSGYLTSDTGRMFALKAIELPGIAVPATTVVPTVSVWRADYPVRDEADFASDGIKSMATDKEGLLRSLPCPAGRYRYHSIAISLSSSSGSAGSTLKRPVEFMRYVLTYED